MKLRLVRELPTGVLRRFPHMEAHLRDLATRKEDFWQLCLDYQDLIHGLEGNPADREELVNLKTSLEVEILEQVSRLQAEAPRESK